MKIYVVYIGKIEHCPPAMSLIQQLAEQNYDVCLYTTQMTQNIKKICKTKKIEFFENRIEYSNNISILSKLLRMLNIRKNFWKYYEKNIKSGSSVIWVLSEVTLKHLGKKLLSQKYILHLLELNESIYYFPKYKLFKLNMNRYGNSAYRVIECEYNRAHITKAWWELDNLPAVLPNKPYTYEKYSKNMKITSDLYAKEVIKKLYNKKIILYQGTISKERPLDSYIKAIEKLGDEYAFLIMSNGENLYQKYSYVSNFYFLSFIEPPQHLEITSHAYIGILSYTPTKNNYSILNTLYCAPNKIFEYSLFGVPMIGNDLPALRLEFEKKQFGICLEKPTIENICKAILEIDRNYKTMSDNSQKYYLETDMNKIVNKILDEG